MVVHVKCLTNSVIVLNKCGFTLSGDYRVAKKASDPSVLGTSIRYNFLVQTEGQRSELASLENAGLVALEIIHQKKAESKVEEVETKRTKKAAAKKTPAKRGRPPKKTSTKTKKTAAKTKKTSKTEKTENPTKKEESLVEPDDDSVVIVRQGEPTKTKTLKNNDLEDAAPPRINSPIDITEEYGNEAVVMEQGVAKKVKMQKSLEEPMFVDLGNGDGDDFIEI